MVVLVCPTCKSTETVKEKHYLRCLKCRDTFNYDCAISKDYVDNNETREHKNRLVGMSVDIINSLIEQLGESGIHFHDKDDHDFVIEVLRYSAAVDKYIVEFMEVDTNA